jgi:HAD superfamily hydrolase (TIGR01509 family)
VSSPGAVFFDVDGTLVDNAYFHVVAWSRACREFDIEVESATLHTLLGMGGDQFTRTLVGREMPDLAESQGRHVAVFDDEVRSLRGSADLIHELHRRGMHLGVATSGGSDATSRNLRRVLPDLSVIDTIVTRDDIAASKPAPELVAVALQRSGTAAEAAILVGDTPWDVEAASRCGVRTIGVCTGGRSEGELRDAGAVAVSASVGDLLVNLGSSPLG